MGLNYYAELEPPCEHCGHVPDRLHIGVSSSGWQFCFAIHYDPEITTVSAWRVFLKEYRILNEYDEDVSYETFWEAVEKSKGGDINSSAFRIDKDGYCIATKEMDFC